MHCTRTRRQRPEDTSRQRNTHAVAVRTPAKSKVEAPSPQAHRLVLVVAVTVALVSDLASIRRGGLAQLHRRERVHGLAVLQRCLERVLRWVGSARLAGSG